MKETTVYSKFKKGNDDVCLVVINYKDFNSINDNL